MPKYVTINQIADQLGVSHSTVSRALNNHPRISKKTTAKIQELAKSLGYEKDARANQLIEGHTKIIALIVPDLSVYFYAKALEGIEDALSDNGYSIMIFSTKESVEKEIKAISSCIRHRVDGVLSAISMQTKTFDHFQKLLDHEVPLIFFDRVANFLPVPKVVTNDYQAAYNATQLLIKSGCKCIGHITASINLNNSNNRLYGYLDALKDHHIRFREDLVHYFESNISSIDIFLSKVIEKYSDFDGLFVFNDYIANYAVNSLQVKGMKIPDEVSVIGFSDEPVATYMTPQLSSVQGAAAQMGSIAAKKLISILGEKEVLKDEKIIIDPALILRGTTK